MIFFSEHFRGSGLRFSSAAEGAVSPDSGGHGEGETPLPIPNRAVKPLSADGTWPARARESRTPPVIPRTGRLRGARSAFAGGRRPSRPAARAGGGGNRGLVTARA